jgi:hypothetical protein
MRYIVGIFSLVKNGEKYSSSYTVMSPEFSSVLEAEEWKKSHSNTGRIIELSVSLQSKRDAIAEKLKAQFGESLIDESEGEDDPYNWWLQDVTVTDIVDFIESL